jgi:hypothetical protein
MARPENRRESVPEETSVAVPPSTAVNPGNVDFTAAGGATVAAILHLVRLLGAELVLVRGLNIAEFEQAVRARLGEFTSPTTSHDARQAGLAQARYLVEQVLTQIRAQAELKKSLAGNQQATEIHPSTHPVSKLLN